MSEDWNNLNIVELREMLSQVSGLADVVGVNEAGNAGVTGVTSGAKAGTGNEQTAMNQPSVSFPQAAKDGLSQGVKSGLSAYQNKSTYQSSVASVKPESDNVEVNNGKKVEGNEVGSSGEGDENLVEKGVSEKDNVSEKDSSENVLSEETGQKKYKFGTTAEEILSYEFGKEKDFDEFVEEAEAYLEQVEVIKPVAEILERYREEVRRSREFRREIEELGEPESIRRTLKAFNALYNYRAGEDGSFIPDTSELVRLIQEDFNQEKNHIIVALNSMPSERYANHTVFEEFLRDYFDLDERQMRQVYEFLSNKGEVPRPQYVPKGIKENLADAYWAHPSREDLEKEVNDLHAIIEDELSGSEEKEQARYKLQKINESLEQVQYGIDARKAFEEATRRQQIELQAQIERETENQFYHSVTELSDNLAGKMGKVLETALGAEQGKLAAQGLMSLISQGLSADAYLAEKARRSLADYGIRVNWQDARSLLDELYEIEQILTLQRRKAETGKYQTTLLNNRQVSISPRAVELAKRNKLKVLSRLNGLLNQASGEIARKFLATNKPPHVNNASTNKPLATRLQIDKTGEPSSVTNVGFDQMPLEDLRKLIQTNPYHDILFGKEPV